MTGLLCEKGGYHAVTDCDVLLMLGTDFAWRQFYPRWRPRRSTARRRF